MKKFSFASIIAVGLAITPLVAISPAQAAKTRCMIDSERYADTRSPTRYSAEWYAAYDEKYDSCHQRECGYDDNGNFGCVTVE